MNGKNPEDEGFALQRESAAPYRWSMEARVAVLEEIARNTEKLFGKMDARMNRMEAMEQRLTARIEAGEAQTDKRLEAMDKRMEAVEVRLSCLEDRHTMDFRWMLGLGMGAVAFLSAVMAHGFHWF